MPTFTVIGIYAETKQRYAQDFEAISAEEAERLAVAECEQNGAELIVAGVVAGRAALVDLAY